jgi:hypothetical protein
VILLLLLGGERRVRFLAGGPRRGAGVVGPRHCACVEVIGEEKIESGNGIGAMMLLLILGETGLIASVGRGEQSFLGWCLFHKEGGMLFIWLRDGRSHAMQA